MKVLCASYLFVCLVKSPVYICATMVAVTTEPVTGSSQAAKQPTTVGPASGAATLCGLLCNISCVF